MKRHLAILTLCVLACTFLTASPAKAEEDKRWGCSHELGGKGRVLEKGAGGGRARSFTGDSLSTLCTKPAGEIRELF